MRILLIGESAEVARKIPFWARLRWPEVEVTSAAGGGEGIKLLHDYVPDLVLMDSDLGDVDVLEMIARIRDLSEVPLMVCVSSKGVDGAQILEAGADDYIANPCNSVEVLTRINALLRRARVASSGGSAPRISAGDLTIDISSHQVFVSGRTVRLTPLEYELLLSLVRNEGRVMTHQMLIERIWGPEYEDGRHLLKKCVSRLRKKLGDDPQEPQLIATQLGVGYMFTRQP